MEPLVQIEERSQLEIESVVPHLGYYLGENGKMNNEIELVCLNCSKSESEIPLVALSYKGERKWICTQCLPILIHKSHKLADKLSGDESGS